LACAIAANGDWDDPELADLVDYAATDPDKGAFLRCVTSKDDEPEQASRAFMSEENEAPLAAAPTSCNPFASQVVSKQAPGTSPSSAKKLPSNVLYDPFRNVLLPSSATISLDFPLARGETAAPNPNPFAKY
jgi:hypothetical protein